MSIYDIILIIVSVVYIAFCSYEYIKTGKNQKRAKQMAVLRARVLESAKFESENCISIDSICLLNDKDIIYKP